MTFLKFYDQYYTDKMLGEMEAMNLEPDAKLTGDQIKALSLAVFDKTDDLVDLDSLVEFLTR